MRVEAGEDRRARGGGRVVTPELLLLLVGVGVGFWVVCVPKIASGQVKLRVGTRE